nr:DUF4233 domain-containing protein [Propioniciclava soli]
MRRALAANLVFEAVVYALAIAGMIQVDAVPVGLALSLGGVAAALALVAAGTLRRPWGWWLGWFVQALGIALGLLTPWMYAVGALFAGLHVLMAVLGRRIDAARR